MAPAACEAGPLVAVPVPLLQAAATRTSAAEGELSSYFTAPHRLAALFDGRRYG